MKNIPALFFKAHVGTYTRKDGTVVQAHEDGRQALQPDHVATLRKFAEHQAKRPDTDNHVSHVPDHEVRKHFDPEHIAELKKHGLIKHGDVTNGDNEYNDEGHYLTEKGKEYSAPFGKDKTPKEAAELREKFHKEVRRPNQQWFNGGSTMLKPGAPDHLRAKVDEHNRTFKEAMRRGGK